MTLHMLLYFRVLAKLQHYTKSAKELHISQPSLSYSIGELEKELGLPLFDRVGKKIRLNNNGEIYLTYVEEALKNLDDGFSAMKKLQTESAGTINIGYIYSISPTITEMIRLFYQDKCHQSIKINFTQNLNDFLSEELLNQTLDLIFSPDPPKSAISFPFCKQELFLIVSKDHPFAKKDIVSLEDIAKEPFIILNRHSSLHTLIENTFKNANVKLNPNFEVNQCNDVLTYVTMNHGIAISPLIPYLSESAVKALKVDIPDFYRTVYVSWLKPAKYTPSLKKVQDFIIATSSGKVI